MSSTNQLRPPSPWPHRWAVVLVCATFPLLWVGGLVTTTDAGMAVPDWPTTYGYNLFLYPWQSWLAGPWDLFIEHGHRLLGALVGMLTIALAITLWRCDGRPWMKRTGAVAFALVVLQGVLGGLRVVLDERLLAMIHACTGPLFFALVVALVVFTSARWLQGPAAHAPAARNLHALAALLCVLLYAQLVLGALLRHMPVGAEPATFAAIVQFHVLLAGVLLLAGCWQVATVWRRFAEIVTLRKLATLLAVLLVVQIALGVSTWAVKYSVAHWIDETSWLAHYTIHAGSWLQTHVVTAHMALGSLLLGLAVAFSLYSARLVVALSRPAHTSWGTWEATT